MLCAVDFVWISLTVLVLVGMWWLGYKMEPHWASKDGTRFLCNSQEIEKGEPVGRLRETRITVMPDGLLMVSRKRLVRRHYSKWQLIGKSPDPPKKLEVYLAQLREDGQTIPSMLSMRVPSKSRCVPVLDAALASVSAPASRRPPGSGRSAGRPGQD